MTYRKETTNSFVMLRLTSPYDTPVWIALHNINAIRPVSGANCNSEISFSCRDREVLVSETPDEVAQLIREATA